MPNQASFTVQQVYDTILAAVSSAVHDRTFQLATLVAFGVFFLAFAALRYFMVHKLGSQLILAFVIAFVTFSSIKGDVNAKMDATGHELAGVAITTGVDQARTAQATQLQYIHAAIIQYGTDTITCTQTVDRHDDCQNLTGLYTHEEINVHYTYDETCTTDSDGDKHCTTTRTKHWNDQYTPYFDHIERRWVVPDTQMKYLHPGVYQMENAGGKPKVYLTGWRAPADAKNHTYNGRGVGWDWGWNENVPEFWTRVQKAGTSGGPVVVATFVGQYYNWGLASESAQFAVYNGEYKQLQKLATLPGPNGATINYTDAFGRPATMHTLLQSKDGDGVPMDFVPVSAIGCDLNPESLGSLNGRALEFQGHFGINKQASARWFLVKNSIVQALGGLRDATVALKAYMNDSSVWGNFSLPKNQVILAAAVSDDCSQIVGKDMETGMPFGNTLVEQDLRLSVPAGTSLPLDTQNLIGTFSGNYQPSTAGTLSYSYSDMTTAGSTISVLYAVTPGWTPPDPSDPACSTAPAEHKGFIRYKMCNEQWRESNIPIHKDGADLIYNHAMDEVANRIPVWIGWAVLIISVILAGIVLYAENQSSSSFR